MNHLKDPEKITVPGVPELLIREETTIPDEFDVFYSILLLQKY